MLCSIRTAHRTLSVRYKSTMAAPATPELDRQVRELDSAEIAAGLPFSRAKIGKFFQPLPVLHNQFLEDVTLRSFLKRYMPDKVFSHVSKDLEQFGQRVATDIYDLAIQCEENKPILKQYDAWGNRVDEIITCSAWKQMKTIAAQEGLISIAYKRELEEFSRVHQMAKLYLYAPSAGLFSCPLAMTDGAAKILEGLNLPARFSDAFSNLITRDPAKFWTSGQWMTERKGGSDVANGTQTYAVLQPDGSYKLYGFKWFTSATDSDMTLTLARPVNSNGSVVEGTRGLSLFYLETRDANGKLNNIEVQKLKDKLGTRQLPTAEMLLDGATAYKISEDGRGVAGIANMLTLTRMHNMLSSASCMRRIINLARDYSTKREAFGNIIKDYPLHIKTLARMEVEARAATLLTMELARLLGREDCNTITEHEKLIFRIMTPVGKLYTAKQAIAVASEGLECFGGQGYLEDTGLPAILRDAQVLSIWEGTTNILSLDVLRSMAKTGGAVLQAFHRDVSQRTEQAMTNTELAETGKRLRDASTGIISFASQHTNNLEVASRDFSFSLARVYMGALMVDHATWEGATSQDVLAARRWCEQDLTPVLSQQNLDNYSHGSADAEFKLVMDGYSGPPSKL